MAAEALVNRGDEAAATRLAFEKITHAVERVGDRDVGNRIAK